MPTAEYRPTPEQVERIDDIRRGFRRTLCTIRLITIDLELDMLIPTEKLELLEFPLTRERPKGRMRLRGHIIAKRNGLNGSSNGRKP